jgi:hypothetical protein
MGALKENAQNEMYVGVAVFFLSKVVRMKKCFGSTGGL